MAVSKDQVKEALGKMPVMELVELISELEEDWGVPPQHRWLSQQRQGPLRLVVKSPRRKPNLT